MVEELLDKKREVFMGLCGDCGWGDRMYTKRKYDKEAFGGYHLLIYCRLRETYVEDFRRGCDGFVDDGSAEAQRIYVEKRNYGLEPPPPGFKKKKCVVCTATLNSGAESNLDLLRGFRDHYIEKSKAGRFLIRRYENIGPALAQHIERNFLMKIISLSFFIKPSLFLLKSKAIRLPLTSNLCKTCLWLIFAIGICSGEIYAFLTKKLIKHGRRPA